MAGETLIDGMFWFVAFLLSTTIHEAAHVGGAARRRSHRARSGHAVADPAHPARADRYAGRAAPHRVHAGLGDRLGEHALRSAVGGAAPAPRARAWPRRGLAANLLDRAGRVPGARIGLATGVFAAPAAIRFEHLVDPVGGGTLRSRSRRKDSPVLLILNVLLMAFNLIPLPPLDGASVIGLLLPADAARGLARFIRTPAFSFLSLVVAWRVFPRLARPLFRAVLTLLHPGSRYG